MEKERKVGPRTEAAEKLHAFKYRSKGEGFKEAKNREASALSDNEEHFRAYREIILAERFLAGGRIQAGIGTTRAVTPYNCFVSGSIEDSFVEGHGSIMDRAREAAATMRMGGGIGYDFSTLRPNGATIKKLASRSSGPVSFMTIYDALCRCIRSAGHRRGAQMGVLRIDHPDIEEFIHAKQNTDQLTAFNISIGVTDAFMEALLDGKPFPLQFNGEVYREIDPHALWEVIMRSTWDWAEPGVLFLDTINRTNNLWYCENICATNPCAEQPLPPHGACLLGSFNLVKYLIDGENGAPYVFDWRQFLLDISHVVRAMDNVVDVAIYPLYEQEKEAKSKRRMGLGITGAANTIEALGHPYGSEGFLSMLSHILEALMVEAYRASVQLAKEKGAFPAFDVDRYMDGRFIRRLPEDIKQGIREHGIRNSHLLSIAPTGTISQAADNVSSAIEPVLDYEVDRTIQTFEGPEVVRLKDYGVQFLGIAGKKARDVTPREHLAVLEVATKFVDSAVSKTCNVPETTKWEDFKDIYVEAWKRGCKGITTYQMGGKREPVIREADDSSLCQIDPESGRRDCE